jgi:hypothetical protein
MFYNSDYVYIFNKFVIYIIGVDLLLSAFVYMKNESSTNQKALLDIVEEAEKTEYPEEESIYSSEDEVENVNEDVEIRDIDADQEIDVDQEIESFSEQLRSTPVAPEPEQPKKKRGRPPKNQETTPAPAAVV